MSCFVSIFLKNLFYSVRIWSNYKWILKETFFLGHPVWKQNLRELRILFIFVNPLPLMFPSKAWNPCGQLWSGNMVSKVTLFKFVITWGYFFFLKNLESEHFSFLDLVDFLNLNSMSIVICIFNWNLYSVLKQVPSKVFSDSKCNHIAQAIIATIMIRRQALQ